MKYIGILPLEDAFCCRPEMLGKECECEIGGVQVTLLFPEKSEVDTQKLEAPAELSSLQIPADWGREVDEICCIRTLAFRCEEEQDAMDALRESLQDWKHKFISLMLLLCNGADNISDEHEPKYVAEVSSSWQSRTAVYRQETDGQLTPCCSIDDGKLADRVLRGLVFDNEGIEEVLKIASAPGVISQPYVLLEAGYRAWLEGEDYNAGVLGGAALMEASAVCLSRYAEANDVPVGNIVVDEDKQEQFELLAQIGIDIPGDWENEIIGVYSDMKYGHMTPDHRRIRRFLRYCHKTMFLVMPDVIQE